VSNNENYYVDITPTTQHRSMTSRRVHTTYGENDSLSPLLLWISREGELIKKATIEIVRSLNVDLNATLIYFKSINNTVILYYPFVLRESEDDWLHVRSEIYS
jgi:hypothetical protein